MENIKMCKCTDDCECQMIEQMNEFACELEHINPEPTLEELICCDDEFEMGVESVSYLLGQLLTLKQAGLANEEVIQLITLQASMQSEREAHAHERHIVDINSKMQIKCEEIKAQAELLDDLINN